LANFEEKNSVKSSVSDPDLVGSGSGWIRIQITMLEPDPDQKVKLSYKNPLFPQNFHDFHLFLKMIGTK